MDRGIEPTARDLPAFVHEAPRGRPGRLGGRAKDDGQQRVGIVRRSERVSDECERVAGIAGAAGWVTPVPAAEDLAPRPAKSARTVTKNSASVASVAMTASAKNKSCRDSAATVVRESNIRVAHSTTKENWPEATACTTSSAWWSTLAGDAD